MRSAALFILQIEKLTIPEHMDLFDLLYQLNHAICTSSTKENKSVANKMRKQQKPAVLRPKPLSEKDEGEDTSSESSVSAIETLSDVDNALRNIKIVSKIQLS